MKLLFNRVRMIGVQGGACSYDVLIPRSEHPCGDRILGGVIMPDPTMNENFLHFSEFFVTENHLNLPEGPARYQDWRRLKEKAINLEDRLLREHFPELRTIFRPHLSHLWISGIDLPHSQKWKQFEVTDLVTA